MAEKLVPVTIGMFRPEECRTLGDKHNVAALLESFIGKGAFRRHLVLKQRGNIAEDEIEEITSGTLNNISGRYGLRELDYNPRRFYLDAQRGAKTFINYFGKLIPELAQSLQMKDEVGLVTDYPGRMYRYLSRPADSLDQMVAYEAQRHAIATVMGADYLAADARGKLGSVLAAVHDRLNINLFKGVEGSGDPQMFSSYHDDDTNDVVGYPGQTSKRITAHEKKYEKNVRSIEGRGYVLTEPREKGSDVTLVKSIAKAKSPENKGVIDITRDIEDGIGMIFVPMDPAVKVEELIEKVLQAVGPVGTEIKMPGEEKMLKIQKIKLEPTRERDRGQSPTLKSRVIKIWFEGISSPIELFFMDRNNYTNSLLEVGQRDQVTGLHQGSSHELYDIRRVSEVVRVPYPRERYPIPIEEALVRRDMSIAQDLRRRYRAA